MGGADTVSVDSDMLPRKALSLGADVGQGPPETNDPGPFTASKGRSRGLGSGFGVKNPKTCGTAASARGEPATRPAESGRCFRGEERGGAGRPREEPRALRARTGKGRRPRRDAGARARTRRPLQGARRGQQRRTARRPHLPSNPNRDLPARRGPSVLSTRGDGHRSAARRVSARREGDHVHVAGRGAALSPLRFTISRYRASGCA